MKSKYMMGMDSFLPRWKAAVPWWMGNYMGKVSCRDGWQWCHVGWETE